MPTIALYDCPRLRARLSLAACEANRNKADAIVALGEDVSLAVRPRPCRDCTDWQAWSSAHAKEVTMAAPQRTTPLLCTECGGETRALVKGLCNKCYQRQIRRKKTACDAKTGPVVAAAPGVAPAPVSTPAESQPASAPTDRRIYLACPYTHEDARVMAERREAATAAANTLLRQGLNVYSPISHGAAVGEGLPPDFAFWRASCLSFLGHWATDVYVLMVPGWEASVGVQAEIDRAMELDLAVTLVLPLPQETKESW